MQQEFTSLDYATAKRFFIVTSIIGILYTALTLLVNLQFEITSLLEFLWFLNVAVAIWLFIEDKILRDFRFYLVALLISISVILYNYTLSESFNIDSVELDITSSFHAITLLLLHWPLRKIFLMIFKKEPVVERTGNFQNIIYTFILAIGMMVIPFLLQGMLIFYLSPS